MKKRRAIGKTPAGSIITVEEAGSEGGLDYLMLNVVNHVGIETVTAKISNNVAWALMRTLGVYLPPNAECSVEFEGDVV